jgi:fructan beta-fructosidase
MKFAATERYLHLPVKNGAAKVVFQLHDGGRLRREFEIELGTDTSADWWACCDLAAFRDGDFEAPNLEIKAVGDATTAVEAHLAEWLRLSPEPPGQDGLYRESGRPQVHFTAQRGWNNDPNGLVYCRGEWHLFFQHNPFGINWGNMHWGHAVSRDLVHWAELPTALYQRGLKDMAFSGGGFVDRGNSAGFGTGQEDVLVVAFTSTGRGECLAYSPDGGQTLVEYGGNPVLRHHGRDPRVIWCAPGRKWVMVVYDEPDNAWRYAFYESTDLRTWRFMTAIDGFYECPDLFELPLDGNPAQRRWVLYGAERREENGRRQVARSSYRVGAFDGRAFSAETPMLNGHLGPNFYAAQSFANAPDGRVIMLGWLQGAAYPGMPFSQGLTVPLEVSLRSTPKGPRLSFFPVPELQALRRHTVALEAPSLAAANATLAGTAAELLDLELELALTRESVVVCDVRGVVVTYDAAVETLTAPGVSTSLALRDGRLDLRLLLDRGVVEAFADAGLVALSYGGAAVKPGAPLRLEIRGPGRVRRLALSELASIWPP